MAPYLDSAYCHVHYDISVDQPTLQELRTQLEQGTDDSKIEVMKRILIMMLNGDPLQDLLMHIIRFVVPSKCKPLKKLLYIYYEICPKLDSSGKLRQEWILVCNGIRSDLQHPNEYVRGNTLRFLCKLQEAELVEPLLQPARASLTHRHTYVRKNAVFAIASIFKNHPELMPDASDLLEKFLEEETDPICKRNGFAALMGIDSDKAAQYVADRIDSIPTSEELVQLVQLEFIRKDAHKNEEMKPKYLRLIFELLETKSHAVVFEAASSLASLTSNPAALKAAASQFIELAIKESDNNVKLIVLNKIDRLRERNEGVLSELVLDLLRVLSSTDIDVRCKTLKIVLECVPSRSVREVVDILLKEVHKTSDTQVDNNNEYRTLLIKSLHQIGIKFFNITPVIVSSLLDFMGDFNNHSSADVLAFIKEVVQKVPELRKSILPRLVSNLTQVRSGKVYRGFLWIVGEYSQETTEIRDAWKAIRSSLGEIPILASEQRQLEDVTPSEEKTDKESKPSQPTGSRRVLADGTYATETALTTQSLAEAKLAALRSSRKPALRQLILDGDFYLVTVLASTLVKLVIRQAGFSKDPARSNSLRAEAMLILISIVRVGQSQFAKQPIDEDSVDRIMSCVCTLSEFSENKNLEEAFIDQSTEAYETIVKAEDKKRQSIIDKERLRKAIQVDDVVQFRQFSAKGSKRSESTVAEESDEMPNSEDLSSRLNRIVQLTGFSDSVYVEAYVKVQQFDIILDVLLVNQTMDTLQKLRVEFATLGDLKVVEKPSVQNVAPHDFVNLRAVVKVSSTNTGVIFGNVIYDGSRSTENHIVILNDLHVDVMDYIYPSTCTEAQFRTMWTEFEWENKVNINTKAKSLREFLQRLKECTNMSCLTPEASLQGECQFLSANLYARSVFGEDALANLSIEQGEDGKITGFVRIRSRSQGLALSLGRLKGLNK